MFAGLPGIGVGTLFYVLTALWMPVRECVLLVRGESSLERWRLIGIQFCFALTIIASVALADRVLMMILGSDAPESANPARLLNEELAVRAPQSILAAPITASFLLLAGVLLTIEVMRFLRLLPQRRRKETVQMPSALPAESLTLSSLTRPVPRVDLTAAQE
jgi:hypothetical protein